MLLWPLWSILACSGDGETPQETADSGETPACALEPCVGTVASASWHTADPGAALGYDLATDGHVVIAGAPAPFGALSHPQAYWLEGSGLTKIGSWRGCCHDLTGLALDVADVGEDGVLDVFVGRADHDEGIYAGGRAHLLVGAPSGDELDIEDESALIVVAGEESRDEYVSDMVGFEMTVADFGSGALEWVVLAANRGELWSFDPTVRGIVGREDALRILTGRDSLRDVGAWDGDCDGANGLVTANLGEVSWHAGPWIADLQQSDADAVWGGGVQQPGHRIRAEGDLDGDGCVDLITSSIEHDDRAGGVFVVPAGAPSSGDVEDLPIQVLGDLAGEAVGYSVASGDLDGDGFDDLLVGATSLHAGPAGGTVRLFLGPLDGSYAPGDADELLHGDRLGDFLGRQMVIVDADGDEQADVVASASSAYGGGAVYLITGADWLGPR